MDAIVKRLYSEYRKKGFCGRDALIAARTRKQWDALESAGFVRLSWAVDDCPFDDSYIDTWTDVPESKRESERRELWRKIEQDGVWGLVGEFRLDPEDSFGWETGDSIWGLVGQDDAGYAVDIMGNTVEEFKKHLKTRCPACGQARLSCV